MKVLLVILVDTCSHKPWIAWDILLVILSVTGNLCHKCPKQLVKQNSSYSDYFNAISGLYRTAEPQKALWQNLPGQRTPWTGTSQTVTPWTENPLHRDPPGQRPPPRERPLDRDPLPQTDTPLDSETANRHHLGRHHSGQRSYFGHANTCKNKTFANFICGPL